MDLKRLASLTIDELDSDERKDEIFDEMILLNNLKNIDSKTCKKLFRLSQFLLKHKGEQVVSLLSELDSLATRQGEMEALGPIDTGQLNEEISNLKQTIEQLETKNNQYKMKIKEQNDEIAYLQKKNQESQFGSDPEDSPDALSDIDRQQELLNNINVKNKHIKRLLRDIESLEKTNSEKTEIISEIKVNLNDATIKINQITNKLSESEETVKEQRSTINFLNTTISDKDEQLENFNSLKIERETEMNQFAKQLEERAVIWKSILDKKQIELENLNEKYNELLERNPGYDIDMERQEITRLTTMVKKRDDVILELESKILQMSKEMIQSTKSMNHLSEMRENSKKECNTSGSQCCENYKLMLKNSNERCKDLQEMFTNIEEDNILKSKQAADAIEALRSYQSGEDGLSQSLKKIAELQQKVNARDKQIRTLIMEINNSNELALENTMLRNRLGIPEDDTIATNSISAKHRKLQKLNDRLNLKLRASEEMRLQLKLEKADLKRKISQLLNKNTKSDGPDTTVDPLENLQGYRDSSNFLPDEIKCCENCLAQFKVSNVVPEDIITCETCSKIKKKNEFCDKCRTQRKFKNSHFDIKIRNLEEDYKIVIEENENLRIGMHEILQKIREYDAESSHITIDSSTLEKLLHALDARSISGWYHPAMRMQNELLATKEKELALRERVRFTEDLFAKTDHKKDETVIIDDAGPLKNELTQNDVKINTQASDANEIKIDKSEIETLEKNLQELKEMNDKLTTENEFLVVYKEQFEKLSATLHETEDIKLKAVLESNIEVTNLKMEILQEKRKKDYIRNDYELLQKSITELRDEQLNLKANFKRDIIEKSKKIIELQEKLHRTQSNNEKVSKTVIYDQQNEIKLLSLKLSNFTSNFFKYLPKIDEDENLLNLQDTKKSDLNQIHIVNDEILTDVITKEELNNFKDKLIQYENDIEVLRCKLTQYEDIIQATDDQNVTQQDNISKCSEDEISLRHLIVDLQSNSNEKHLIAKLQRELFSSKNAEEQLKISVNKLEKEKGEILHKLEEQKSESEKQIAEMNSNFDNSNLKVKYLKTIITELHRNYSKFTPLLHLNDFINLYTVLRKLRENLNIELESHRLEDENKMYSTVYDRVIETVKNSNNSDIKNVIEIVKYQTESEHWKMKMDEKINVISGLQSEIDNLKFNHIEHNHIWNAVEILFSNNENKSIKLLDKSVQSVVETTNKVTSTDDFEMIGQNEKEVVSNINEGEHRLSTTGINEEDDDAISSQSFSTIINQKSLESQLKQAIGLASTRSTLLLETENRLAESHGRVKAMEKLLEDKEKLLKEQREKISSDNTGRKEENILSVTISSLQKLLLEKDTTLSRYQELLKTERQEQYKSFEESQKEIKSLKEEIYALERSLMEKNKEIHRLETEKSDKILFNKHNEDNGKSDIIEAVDDSVNGITFDERISDNFIENMFMSSNDKNELDLLDDRKFEIISMKQKLSDADEEITKLQMQLREVSNREKIWEKNLIEKDNEIKLLNETLSSNSSHALAHRDGGIYGASRNEIDQLREMLEEKDRHIQDLTDTLTHFHDDQQKFITDTSLHSAEQVSQLSADLNRLEATNRVLNTQNEALKRQISNLSQREKQARELVKTLKNQLIRRPVISLKPERIVNSREDQLNRKVQQLEGELNETKEELRRQTHLAESRRAKNAVDLDLWSKQKHWQQTSEKLKQKLKEKDEDIEKIKASLSIAKNSIARLEREKHLLENRSRNVRYCSASSCPNQHNQKPVSTAESPESFDSHTDSTSSDSQRPTDHKHECLEKSPELLESLKSRIEMQQRRIIAMELEGRGSNVMAQELDKLQERCSSLEAQNIRLEAKNLQLQLDNDMMKQGDDGERLKRQIKHLEEYVLVLKDELGQALSINAMSSHVPSTSTVGNQHGRMDQTILALRNVVEKLKVENKNLKEGIGGYTTAKHGVSKEVFEKLRVDHDKLQHLYSEALDKISTMRIDSNVRDLTTESTNADLLNEFRTVREKLNQKTQLLEKAKILLTRAAAKEKNLREQIDYWRRRCSELSNVPVIEETSEGEIMA